MESRKRIFTWFYMAYFLATFVSFFSFGGCATTVGWDEGYGYNYPSDWEEDYWFEWREPEYPYEYFPAERHPNERYEHNERRESHETEHGEHERGERR